MDFKKCLRKKWVSCIFNQNFESIILLKGSRDKESIVRIIFNCQIETNKYFLQLII